MRKLLVYPIGSTAATAFAVKYLKQEDIPLVDHPTPEVTHLLLDVPSREIPQGLLERLPETITVTGGNLTQPELESYRKMDFLKNESYLANNAAITADCAIRVAAARMKSVFSGSPALVIGWGRIGKCLSSLLAQIGCIVTVATRKDSDRGILRALGYQAVDSGSLTLLKEYKLIFNTAPAPVLDKATLSQYPEAIKIDLASSPGLDGPDIIWARGLPNLYAPESSGALIADTFLKEVRL